MTEFVKPPEPFSFEEPNAPQRWARWEKQFNTYFVAAELSEKSKEVQVARLLNAAGEEAQEIHELFVFAAEDDKKDYKKVLEKFREYCRPKKNVVFERHRFWSRSQKEDELFDRWLKDLRVTAKDCEFSEEDNMLRDKIVFSVYDKKVQERMLRKSDLTLADAVEYCRAAESSQKQLAEIRKGNPTSFNEVSAAEGPSVRCFTCNTWGHFARDCPKKEEEEEAVQCCRCGGLGHQVKDCPSPADAQRPRRPADVQQPAWKRKKKRARRGRGGRGAHGSTRAMNEVDESVAQEYAQEFASLSLHTIKVSSMSSGTRKRFVKFRFHDPGRRRSKVEDAKIDSCAEANAMSISKYKEIYPDRVDENGVPDQRFVRKSDKRLEAYGGVEIPHFGTVNVPVEYAGKKFMCRFFLCDIEGSILLGLPTCEALGIIRITIDNVSEGCVESQEMNQSSGKEGYISPSVPMSERPAINTKEDLLRMYPECFDPHGKFFKNFEYEIKIDPDAKPKIHPPRRCAIELKEKFREKLLEMKQRGIIVEVDEQTPWVNSCVVETKPNGDIRVCLDPTDLNRAVLRDHHPIPVVEDIVPGLAGSDLFSKLDLNDGYWHVKLTERSSYLTTFSTPFGKFRYARLPFGLCVSQDVFQRKIDKTYGPCEGTIGISDDVTLHGKGEKNHDQRLHQTMETTREANLCLNFKKLEIKKPSVKFFGNVYSAQGVSADPEKIKAITSMRPPETKGEVKSFLGMVNYLQKFVPRLSEHTGLLRSLEKKGVHFSWDADHQQAFDRIKELLLKDVTLAYYDRSKPVTLQTDYSESGIGVALVQEGRPVQFASKSLTSSEKNYAPIEGEMLGVVYGIKKFHNYLYGRRFTVECDHKPLHHIHKKNLSLSAAPAWDVKSCR